MPDVTRRATIQGLGASAVLALSPLPLQADVPVSFRTVEECFGPRRMARIAELCAGAPVRGTMATLIRKFRRQVKPLPLVDDEGRFRLLPEFRQALTLVLNGYEQVRLPIGDESRAKMDAGESVDNEIYGLALWMDMPVSNFVGMDYDEDDDREWIIYQRRDPGEPLLTRSIIWML